MTLKRNPKISACTEEGHQTSKEIETIGVKKEENTPAAKEKYHI